MSHEDKYFICSKLDDPKMYCGLTLDEFIPVILLNGFCFIFISLFIGMLLSGGFLLAMRHLKKGQGQSWFFNWLYWHLPLHYLKGVLFIKTPPSSARHWLA